MRRVGAAGYSQELRERIVRAVRSGKTIQAVADHYEVNRNTVRSYLKKAEAGTLHTDGQCSGRQRVSSSSPRARARTAAASPHPHLGAPLRDGLRARPSSREKKEKSSSCARASEGVSQTEIVDSDAEMIDFGSCRSSVMAPSPRPPSQYSFSYF